MTTGNAPVAPITAQLEGHAAAVALIALAAIMTLLLTWEAIAQVRAERRDRRQQDQDAADHAAALQAGTVAGWHDTIDIPRPRGARR